MSGCQVKGGSLEIRHGHLRRLELDRTTFDWMGTAVEVDAPALEAMSASGLLLCEALAVRGSPQLRSLVVENCFARKEEALGVSLEVEAPGVRRFRFVGAVGRVCSMGASPHLDDVEVEVHPWREGEDGDNSRWVGELLKGVSCARSLTLSAGCLQCLTTEMGTPETLPNPFHHLKVLKLEVGLVSEELPGIACLLRSSPNLQTLSISLGDESHDATTDSVSLDYELQNLDQLYGDYWESQESPINCLVHHLKRIEISNYRGKRLEEELARFLVTNAMVLKEMPISTLTSSFSGFDFL
uniref:Putative F-box/FBD/LRR-repeat protein At4g03220 n=1 Tax=Anthurium amnicola TaxID=1678845 RepID=A0A1D1Y554_9ARAE